MKYSQNSRRCSRNTMNKLEDRLNEVYEELEEFHRYNKMCSRSRHSGIDLTGGAMSNMPCWYFPNMKEHAENAHHLMKRAVVLFNLCANFST